MMHFSSQGAAAAARVIAVSSAYSCQRLRGWAVTYWRVEKAVSDSSKSNVRGNHVFLENSMQIRISDNFRFGGF